MRRSAVFPVGIEKALLFPQRRPFAALLFRSLLFRGQQLPVGADGDDSQRNLLAAFRQRLIHGILQPAAAGHEHPAQRDRPNVVVLEDCRQLPGNIVLPLLWTGNHRRASRKEIPMEVSTGRSKNLYLQIRSGEVYDGFCCSFIQPAL